MRAYCCLLYALECLIVKYLYTYHCKVCGGNPDPQHTYSRGNKWVDQMATGKKTKNNNNTLNSICDLVIVECLL